VDTVATAEAMEGSVVDLAEAAVKAVSVVDSEVETAVRVDLKDR